MQHGIEYHVGDKVFDEWKEAAAHAMSVAASTGEATIDVIVYDEDGAKAYGGDDAVERYLEDPDASVFERLEVKVNNAGRIP